MAAVPPQIHRTLARQHGHVSRTQLLAALTENQIQHLVRRGDLVDAGRRVYRSPSAPVTEIGRCAAVCLGLPGVTIAGPTAGRTWGFRKMQSDRRLHVLMEPHANSVSDATFADGTAIVARRTQYLRSSDIVHRDDGVRVTNRVRTCVDLARMLRPDDLLSVMEQAMLDGSIRDGEMLAGVLHLHPRHPGRSAFLEQLQRRLRGRPAESDGEVRLGLALVRHRVIGLVRQHAIHLPGFGPARFDLAVPDLKLAIELDLFPTHRSTVGAAADRRRDSAAAGIGWTVRRVSHRQFTHEFERAIDALVAEIRELRSSLELAG